MSDRRLRVTAVAVAVSVVAACGNGGSAEAPESAAMMAAAMHQLLTVDHTYGGDSPFRIFLIEDWTFDVDSKPELERVHPAPTPARALTSGEREAVETALGDIGEVRWVEDIMEWYDGSMPTIEGSVLVEIGTPVVDGETGFVPVSLLCGNVCGTWFTYRLTRSDDGWTIDGIEGSVATS